VQGGVAGWHGSAHRAVGKFFLFSLLIVIFLVSVFFITHLHEDFSSPKEKTRLEKSLMLYINSDNMFRNCWPSFAEKSIG